MIESIGTDDTGVEAVHGSTSSTRSWQILSALGVVIALVGVALRGVPARGHQGLGFLTFLLVAAAVLATARLLFAPAWRAIAARPDLLVPIGVVLLAQESLGWLARVPALAPIFSPASSGRFLGLSLELSVAGMLGIALWAAFAAWQTDLLIHDARDPGRSMLDPWASIRRGFVPSLAAIALGTVVLLAGMVLCLALFAVATPLGLLAVCVLAVAWNLATAALLPTALLMDGPIASRLAAGLRESWRRKSRWWGRLLAQLLLLGLVTFSYSHTRTSTPTPGGGTRVDESSRSSYHVHAAWVGGYENGGHWYADAMANARSEPVPVLAWLLGVEFLVLAVAMKWTVIRALVGKEGKATAKENEAHRTADFA